MAKKEVKKTEESEDLTEPQEEPISKEKARHMEKEVKWVILGMAVVLVVFLVAYYGFKAYTNSMNSFEYKGLSFTKEKFDELTVYHYYYFYNKPIRDLTGRVISSGDLVKYNLYLQRDPRGNNIPVEGGKIDLSAEKKAYVSVNATGLEECSMGTMSIAGLSSFLIDNSILIKSASPDEQIAEELKVKYATCETQGNSSTVILIQSGEETEVRVKNKDCYLISVANCEILEALEKFEVQAILDAKTNRTVSEEDVKVKSK